MHLKRAKKIAEDNMNDIQMYQRMLNSIDNENKDSFMQLKIIMGCHYTYIRIPKIKEKKVILSAEEYRN